MALHKLDTARLAALKTALDDDKAALAEKGVRVPESTKHDGIAALIRQISGADDEVREFSQMNARVAAYLPAAEVAYNADNIGTTIMGEYASTQTHYCDPNGYALTLPSAGTLYLMDETEPRYSWSVSADGSYTVYNLIPNHIYRYLLVDAAGKTVANGKLQATGKIRMIYIEISGTSSSGTVYDHGGANCRDLGGWDCDGGTVRYGLLYRSMQLEYFNANDKHTLLDVLKIKQEIDFRKDDGEAQNSFFAGENVAYNNFPQHGSGYPSMVEIADPNAKMTAKTLVHMMDCVVRGVPTLFHCSLGADRTGVIATLLLGLLGVSQVDCDIHYELTALAGELYKGTAGEVDVTNRTRAFASYVALTNLIKSYGKGNLRDNLLYWCARMGIPAALVNAYRKAMSTGAPETVSYNNTVTANLTNLTSNNSVTEVANGSSYTATLTLGNGATISSLVITMNGENITGDVWDADTRTITIPEVTGDIVITAVASTTQRAVTLDLTDCVSSNQAATAELGQAYTTVLSPLYDGYALESVTVTMGGVDVTATAYADGLVSIAAVTGDIVITAVASVSYNVTNVLAEAIDTDGSIYNGVGYINGKRLTSSTHHIDASTTHFASGWIANGFAQSAMYLRGVDMDSSDAATTATRLYFYDADFAIHGPYIAGLGDSSNTGFGYWFSIEKLGNLYYKFTPKRDTVSPWNTNIDNMPYIRVSLPGQGEDVIIAFEPIG